MFHHLSGIITELSPACAAIECAGVGFAVIITPNTASMLKTGEKACLHISESIGEDHFDLYGFPSPKEKKFFELLISVSGVGPKAAMSILSYNSPDNIIISIANGDEKAFTACQGIGKKTAQRIILELKDKIAKDFEAGPADIQLPARNTAAGAGAYDEALAALSALGYSTAEVIPVLRQIDISGMNTGDIIKSVLKYMV